MHVRVVLAVALALVGAGLVAVLSQRDERMAGTGFIASRTFVATLEPGQRACQPGTYVAADSAAAVVGAGGGFAPRVPALSLTVEDAQGRLVARGALPAGAREGDVRIPFARTVARERYGTTACVRNDGADPVALGGDVAGPAGAVRVDGTPTQGAVAFRWLRPGRESWWSLAGTVSDRFGLGKSGVFGSWTLPLLGLMLAGLWFAALRLLVRETRA